MFICLLKNNLYICNVHLGNKMELPEYYKTVIFRDMNGKEHRGYLEPPFGGGNEDCFFFEEDSDDTSQGLGGMFYYPDYIESWEYAPKPPEPPEVNHCDVIFE